MASFSINNFLSQVEDNGGLLRTNKFLVRFPTPRGLLDAQNADGQIGAMETARFLEYWCDSASIPALIYATHNVTRYGYGTQENKPFLNQIQNVNFTFISDGNAAIWNFFYEWMNIIINTRLENGIMAGTNGMQPYEVSYKGDYVSDITVIVHNDRGEPAYNIVLREAFPVFLGDVSLNWSEKNNIIRFPVTFTFHSWYTSNITE